MNTMPAHKGAIDFTKCEKRYFGLVDQLLYNYYSPMPIFLQPKPTLQPLGSVSSKMSTDTGLSSSIQSGSVTKDNSLGLSGTVASGATVSIYDGKKFLGYAIINGGIGRSLRQNLMMAYTSFRLSYRQAIKTSLSM